MVARRRGATGAIWLALLTAACGSPALPPKEAQPRLLIAQAPVPAETLSLPLAYHPAERDRLGAERPEWGLALSGGGVRAAMFSAGVMKALHDRDRLRRFDAISTVSGGGYAGYWLFASAHRAGERRGAFGQAVFGDEAFAGSVCRLGAYGNFVTYAGGALAALRGKAPEHYEERLRRAFGPGDDGRLQLHDLAPAMAPGGMPYWVLGTTSDGAAATRPLLAPGFWPATLFELSPILRGHPFAGQKPWGENEPEGGSILLAKAAAISGAAQAPLKQDIANPEPYHGGKTVRLWDGGKSENLGAIALIRRGARKILIVDAEHDPRYRFGAYARLRDNLKLYGARLRIEGIEKLLAEPTPALAGATFRGSIAFAPGAPLARAEVLYLKMAVDGALRERLADGATAAEAIAAGRREQQALDAAIDATAEGKGPWRCERTRFTLAGKALENWALYSVERSDRTLRGLWRRRLIDLLGIDDAKLHFPQYTTLDQSYFLDQTRGLIGLGYLQGAGAAAELDALDAAAAQRAGGGGGGEGAGAN